MIDFHTHILPSIDDGARTVEESINMLKSSYGKGIRTSVLTPHFYPKGEDSLKPFLERREKAYELLKRNVACETEIPELRLGCEVNLATDVSEYDGIERLCIEGTDYILLEIPHNAEWNEELCDKIYNVRLKGLKPIVAHIDRYLPIPKKALKDLSEVGALYQMNADAFLYFGLKKEAARLFEKGFVHILGSDMHNLKDRPNNMDKAIKELKAHFSDEHIRYLHENAEAVINNKDAHRRWHKYLPPVRMRNLIFSRKTKD